ncbi:MAG: hypothetical protein U5N85_16505 [Arcicella sp.]|nr:hypothetical protein [Arcicella sp.]
MLFSSQNWLSVIAISFFVIAVLSVWSRYFSKFAYNYINDVEDLSKHYDKFLFPSFFLGN